MTSISCQTKNLPSNAKKTLPWLLHSQYSRRCWLLATVASLHCYVPHSFRLRLMVVAWQQYHKRAPDTAVYFPRGSKKRVQVCRCSFTCSPVLPFNTSVPPMSEFLRRRHQSFQPHASWPQCRTFSQGKCVLTDLYEAFQMSCITFNRFWLFDNKFKPAFS